jgi:hypothetical protein
MNPKPKLSTGSLIRHWRQEYYSTQPNIKRMRNLEAVLLKHNIKIVQRSGPPKFIEIN